MPDKTPDLAALIAAEPDLVDRIFDYIFSEPAMAAAMQSRVKVGDTPIQALKDSVRAEFAGERHYIKKSNSRAKQILALFNHRNATEVARRLDISRATVYRTIKQSGGK